MITKTIIPKSKTNDAFFRYDIPFDGDISKVYSCDVINSNLPVPKFIKFVTKGTDSPQNYIQLEFASRCNNTQMTISFMTEMEVIEEKKVQFLTWLAGYFTWLAGYFTWMNFIFKLVPVRALKFITKAIAVGVAIPIAFGLIYAVTEYTYETVTGDDFEDSVVVEYWSNFTIPAIGNYFREDALDDAEELGEYLKEKSSDAIEATKEKAEDLKESVADKIDDIRD